MVHPIAEYLVSPVSCSFTASDASYGVTRDWDAPVTPLLFSLEGNRLLMGGSHMAELPSDEIRVAGNSKF